MTKNLLARRRSAGAPMTRGLKKAALHGAIPAIPSRRAARRLPCGQRTTHPRRRRRPPRHGRPRHHRRPPPARQRQRPGRRRSAVHGDRGACSERLGQGLEYIGIARHPRRLRPASMPPACALATEAGRGWPRRLRTSIRSETGPSLRNAWNTSRCRRRPQRLPQPSR